MDLAANGWFFVAVVLGAEYGMKEFFELLPASLLKKKRIYWLYRLLHWALLTCLLGVFFTSPYPWFIWPLTSLGASLLGSVELVGQLLEQRLRKVIQANSYFSQFLLMLIEGWVAFQTAMMIRCRTGKLLTSFIDSFQVHFGTEHPFTGGEMLAVCAVVILLAYPVNYVIRWLVSKSKDNTLPELIICYQGPDRSVQEPVTVSEVNPADTSPSPSIETIRAGRVIGILERWLIMVLMLSGQYAGIGFVLTAKSIARFKNFDQEQFAEYYLMGTLYSALFAIGLSLILINLG